jgi:hypothetical protein
MVGQQSYFGLLFPPITKHKSQDFQTQNFKTKRLIIGPLLNGGHEMGVCQWVVCLFLKDVHTITFVLTLASLPYRDLINFTTFFLNFGN